MVRQDDDVRIETIHEADVRLDPVPEELDRRMHVLFANLREQERAEEMRLSRRKRMRMRLASVSLVAVIVLIASIGPKQVWTASQEAVNVVIRTVQSYSTLAWRDKEDKQESLEAYVFTYLPGDMTEYELMGDAQYSMRRLESEGGDYILFTQNVSTEHSLLIDTEQTNIRMIKDDDRLYYYYQNKDQYNIIWEENGQNFNLNSSLNFDRLFDVARGLVPAP